MEDSKELVQISQELSQTGSKTSSDFSIKWYSLLVSITNLNKNEEERIKEHQKINATLVDECQVTIEMKYLPEIERISDKLIKYKKERESIVKRRNSISQEIDSFTNSITELQTRIVSIDSDSDDAKKINLDIESLEFRSKNAEKQRDILERALGEYNTFIEGQEKYSSILEAAYNSFFEFCFSINGRNGGYISAA
jgi:hypothetical protein